MQEIRPFLYCNDDCKKVRHTNLQLVTTRVPHFSNNFFAPILAKSINKGRGRQWHSAKNQIPNKALLAIRTRDHFLIHAILIGDVQWGNDKGKTREPDQEHEKVQIERLLGR